MNGFFEQKTLIRFINPDLLSSLDNKISRFAEYSAKIIHIKWLN